MKIPAFFARFIVVLLLSLAACGEEEGKGGGTGGEQEGPGEGPEEGPASIFRLHVVDGSEESFAGFTTYLRGPDPVTISTCSEDPTPQVQDDEKRLCLTLELDAAGLFATGSSATLPIQGEAVRYGPRDPTPTAFTAAAGNSPVVLKAWATVVCFSTTRNEPLMQQVDGRLEVTTNTADRLAGRVVLTSVGDLASFNCRKVTSADFDFTFDVARP